MHPPWADDLDPKRASRRRTRRLGVWSPWSCGAWGKNNAEDWALQSALDLEYGRGGADCHPIQQAGACFEPYDLQFHASYTFNDYYIQNVSQQACDSGGSVALTSLNPGALPNPCLPLTPLIPPSFLCTVDGYLRDLTLPPSPFLIGEEWHIYQVGGGDGWEPGCGLLASFVFCLVLGAKKKAAYLKEHRKTSFVLPSSEDRIAWFLLWGDEVYLVGGFTGNWKDSIFIKVGQDMKQKLGFGMGSIAISLLWVGNGDTQHLYPQKINREISIMLSE
ncbi:hypothetical protein Taro_002420 [Colocasia esculenta]|uniref:X8 domain-containing protein n=1 Tax=Colocasia esculenta TaxID=4460 RepID=A0A843TE20_COLES|nr:hypothetical protein [Colocasia esculenta]